MRDKRKGRIVEEVRDKREGSFLKVTDGYERRSVGGRVERSVG